MSDNFPKAADPQQPRADAGQMQGQRMPVPNTSLLPGSEKLPHAAVGLLRQAVRGAHHSIDRLADGVAPTVGQLGERAAAVQQTWRHRATQWGEASEVWAAGARSTVCRHPLTCIAAALAVGAVLARLTRR